MPSQIQIFSPTYSVFASQYSARILGLKCSPPASGLDIRKETRERAEELFAHSGQPPNSSYRENPLSLVLRASVKLMTLMVSSRAAGTLRQGENLSNVQCWHPSQQTY